ncbi:serine/threonine-protein kinase [Spirilliplanes yamanashiensis]|uniref:serine/threonine-protein kinase n=1 Tax=Spirilliplanes yamanashiensis TaxID=42233 RepID=UPI001EF1A0F2|nr:serine/threonine-protein kinase [Spirilliplanes yamanashiensis]MDP9819398.1 putative Ser/Thr protein kinase [Spirilliplanes yamanashiensis]
MSQPATPRSGPLRQGDPARLGRYELLGRLGSGGMGVVFLARDEAGRRVAVKVVHADLAGDDEFRRRFRSEVERARQVPPFCTAELIDADTDAPRPYLVVEYVDGPSLAQAVDEQGPLTVANLHAVAIGVATALTAIHGAGIVHRDLKPRNVLLAPGSPKVIDFGIARALEATSQNTRTGQLVGTVAYMAPERFATEPGTPLTPAADIFAWGCVVAFAGTGRTPFQGDSPAATAARILTQAPDLRGLDGPLRHLVELSLVTDPAERPTARDLLDLLIGSGAQRSAQLVEALEQQPALRRAATQMQGAATSGVHQHMAHLPAGDDAADTEITPHVVAVPGRHVQRHAQRRAGRGRRALVAVLAVLGVLTALGAGFLGVRAAGVFDGSAASPGPSATAGPSAAPAPRMSLPPGEPFIVDALTTRGQWTGTFVVGEEGSNCDVTDGALRVNRVAPGFFTCAGPEKQLSGDHTIAVTARIEQPGTCLGVWLYWSQERSYQLTACEDAFRIAVDRDGAVSYVLRDVPLAATLPVGQDVRLQVVVRDGVVRFGHDDVQVAEAPLPEADIDRGRPMIGLVSAPGDDTPPYGATFNDIEVRTLTP